MVSWMPSVLKAGARRAQRNRHAPPPAEVPDDVLLTRYASTDPDDAEAASAFVRRFQSRVYGLALLVLGQPGVAEQVARDALLRARRDARLFDARRDNVTAWLLRITRNLATDAMRVTTADAIDRDWMLSASHTRAESQAVGAQPHADDAARGALGDLPDDLRRAVLLAGVWGLSAHEIAHREGITIGTARERLRDGLTRMRQARRQQPDSEPCR